MTVEVDSFSVSKLNHQGGFRYRKCSKKYFCNNERLATAQVHTVQLELSLICSPEKMLTSGMVMLVACGLLQLVGKNEPGTMRTDKERKNC